MVVDLVTAGDIAEMLGVSRPRVHQLANRPDFPKAEMVVGGRRLWKRSSIVRWEKTWDRTSGGRPRTTT